ncbi:biotin/lipoyl-containing protein [Ruminococcus sp.]|uniref:biotin/lipoyl-containing protein n=1 Tax=Ruminococcus sp. TaxID=41978 RepID=UPI00388E3223
MKNLRITVNGVAYDVQVEELGADASVAAAPAPAKAAAPVKAAPAKKAAAGAGEKVAAPMPGTIVSVNVSDGQSVKKGDVLVVLEAMKMENEIKAPNDGTITSVAVSKGESVDTGATLVTIG